MSLTHTHTHAAHSGVQTRPRRDHRDRAPRCRGMTRQEGVRGFEAQGETGISVVHGTRKNHSLCYNAGRVWALPACRHTHTHTHSDKGAKASRDRSDKGALKRKSSVDQPPSKKASTTAEVSRGPFILQHTNESSPTSEDVVQRGWRCSLCRHSA